MSADEYTLTEFPSDEKMERAARKCQFLAHCDNRPFSFCLDGWVNVNGKLMFRKVTYKHCWECLNDVS